jgi:hypothetical protein
MAKTCCKNHFFLLLLTPQGQAKMTDRARGVSRRKKIFYNMVTKLCRASAIEE